MANLKPNNRGSYHKFKDMPDIKDLKWPARKFIIIIYKEDLVDITSREMAGLLKCPVALASSKLGLLKQWNCLQITKRGKGRKPHIYNITEWGKKMAEKWSKK